jgi:hypothetical protein
VKSRKQDEMPGWVAGYYMLKRKEEKRNSQTWEVKGTYK